ncbi:MAG: cytochrome c-type biogenesis protein CcmH [Gammaproteobacteria bacterium]|nr:cytochrome c-type biogenesis protein CcmH [Gammaproteobacteria bacterium]
MRVLAFLALLISGLALADINAYPFASPEQEAQFRRLTQELRCPKCQNQNLADSDAPLAKDLRDIIFEKLQAGESPEQIEAYLHKRYGDFILYKPPVKPTTWLLWFGPGLFLAGGVAWLLRAIARRRAQPSAPQAVDEERLKRILKTDSEQDRAS